MGTAAMLENLGGCCEGTVFTFTSAASSGRSRQRLNRYKVSLLSAHGGLHLKEPTDSVFTEMRMMPRSSDDTSLLEIYPTATSITSTATEEGGRESHNDDDGSRDARSRRRIKKLREQTGGNGIKLGPLQAAGGENERETAGEEIMQGQPSPRKSRRPRKRHDYNERQKFAEQEVDKTCTWKQDKKGQGQGRSPSSSGDNCFTCKRPAEGRRNKRDSCREEIHVFEQRKVKCARRKEHDSCGHRFGGLQSDGQSQMENGRKENSTVSGRTKAGETGLAGNRAGLFTDTGSYEADETHYNHRGILSSLSISAKAVQKGFHPITSHKIGHLYDTKEGDDSVDNRACPPLLNEFNSESAPPCTFISFKNLPAIEHRFRSTGTGSLMSRASSSMEIENARPYEREECQWKEPLNSRFFKQSTVQIVSIPSRKTKINPKAKFPDFGENMESRCAQIEGRADKAEPIHRQRPEGPESIGLSNILAVGNGRTEEDSEESCNATGARMPDSTVEGFETKREGDDQIISFKAFQTTEDNGKSIGADVGNLVDEVGEDDAPPKKRADGQGAVRGFLSQSDHSRTDLLDKCPIYESGDLNDLGGEVATVGILSAKDDLSHRRVEEEELQNPSLKEVESEVSDEKKSSEGTVRSENQRAEFHASGTNLQKKLSKRRQTWAKGFKKTTGERVSYFESWLVRGKTVPLKLCKSSLRTRRQTGDGNLELSDDVAVNKLNPDEDCFQQNLTPQAQAQLENEADHCDATKEFKVHESVLQSLKDGKPGVKGTDISDGAAAGIALETREEWNEHSRPQVLKHEQKIFGSLKLDASDGIKHEKRGAIKTSLSQCEGRHSEEELAFEGLKFEELNSHHQADKTFTKFASSSESKALGLQSLSSNGDPADCREIMESACRSESDCIIASSSSDGLISSRRYPKSQIESQYQTEKNSTTFLSANSDKGRNITSHSSERLFTSTLQALDLAEQREFVSEKKCSSQDKQLGKAYGKGLIAYNDLIVLNDSKLNLAKKMPEHRESATQEVSLANTQESFKQQIPGGANDSCMANSCSKEVFDNSIGKGFEHSKQLLSPSRECPVLHISEHSRQGKDSILVETESPGDALDDKGLLARNADIAENVNDLDEDRLQMAQTNCTLGGVQSKVSSSKAEFELCDLSDTAFRKGPTKSVEVIPNNAEIPTITPQPMLGSNCPSCLERPTAKEAAVDEKVKESFISRRHTMPMMVRVRNRLSKGWHLQHHLWKSAQKPKLKLCDIPTPAGTTCLNQRGDQVDAIKASCNQECSAGSRMCPMSDTEAMDASTGILSQSNTEEIVLNPQAQLETPVAAEGGGAHCSKLKDFSGSEQYQTSKQLTILCNDEIYQNALQIDTADPTASASHDIGSQAQMKMHDIHAVAAKTDDGTSEHESARFGGPCAYQDRARTAALPGCSHTGRNLSNMDQGEGFINAGKRKERHCAEFEESSNCSADRHVLEANSKSKCSSCHTQQMSEACIPEQLLEQVPSSDLVNRSAYYASSTTEESAPLTSGHSSYVIKHSAPTSQIKVSPLCSSTSVNRGTHYLPNMIPKKDVLIREGDSADLQSNNTCSTLQVHRVPNKPLEEAPQSVSVLPLSVQHLSHPDRGGEEQHEAMTTFTHFGESPRINPVYPSSNDANCIDRKYSLVLKDRPSKGLPCTSSQKRGTQRCTDISETPGQIGFIGDPRQAELMETRNVPYISDDNLPKILAKTFIGDDQGYTQVPNDQRNACNSYEREDLSEARASSSRNERFPYSLKEGSTEEVFLERFSATCNGMTVYKHPERKGMAADYKHTAVALSGQHNLPGPPSEPTTRGNLLSSTGTFYKERLSSTTRAEPSSQHNCSQSTYSMHPNSSNPISVTEANIPSSVQEYQHTRYSDNELKSQFSTYYKGSADYCTLPSTSRNGTPDILESHLGAYQREDRLNEDDHRVACYQTADGLHDWKSSSTQGELLSSSLPSAAQQSHHQNLIFNSYPSSCCSRTTSQPGTPCVHDSCNYGCQYSPSLLLRCQPAHCNAYVQNHNQCYHTEHSHTALGSMAEAAMLKPTKEALLHTCSCYCATKTALHPYKPLQVSPQTDLLQSLSHTCSQPPALPHDPSESPNKSSMTRICQKPGFSKTDPANGKDPGRGLIWLSDDEMNLIWQLRLSSGKAVTVDKHNAAATIQRNWRKYSETEDFPLDETRQGTARSHIATDPCWHGHPHCNFHQNGTSLKFSDASDASDKDLGNGDLVQKPFLTMQGEARTIQRACLSALKRNKRIPAASELPKNIKEFYILIKSRGTSSVRHPPSYQSFLKSIEQIQAATEGARVRRRLKSRRVQTIVMEIKEIRMLLREMSQEAKHDSTPYLFPQLSTQLRQKIMQLQAALNSQQMEARFLLRRRPATSLVAQSSRSTSPQQVGGTASQNSGDRAYLQLSTNLPGTTTWRKSIDQTLIISSSPRSLDVAHSQRAAAEIQLELSGQLNAASTKKNVDSSPIGQSSDAFRPQRLYNPPLITSASTVLHNTMTLTQHLPEEFGVPEEEKGVNRSRSVWMTNCLKGRETPSWSSTPDAPDSADASDSVRLFPSYHLAHQSPSERSGGHLTPVGLSDQQVSVKRDNADNLGTSQTGSAPTLHRDWTESSEAKNQLCNAPKCFDDQPLPLPQREKLTEMSFENLPAGVSNSSMNMTDYDPLVDVSDKPKRPFLKRKSIMMPTQKLDWSKVKPMVSTRLEPELKTKLAVGKITPRPIIPAKEHTKPNSKMKKGNYGKVKSRLFSYEENVSPSASGDLRTCNTVAADGGYASIPGRLTRDYPTQRTESGQTSRALLSRQRVISPDLHLRRNMADVDGVQSQPSTPNSEGFTTYDSHVNSARYIHKMDSTEQASNGTVSGPFQQYTQRIRLRVLPRSKENTAEGLFFQEIKVHEEPREIPYNQPHRAERKDRRQQSHSHRYAVYQDSEERDAESPRETDRLTRLISQQVVPSPKQEIIHDPARRVMYNHLEHQ